MKQSALVSSPGQRVVARLRSEGWVDCPGLGFPALWQHFALPEAHPLAQEPIIQMSSLANEFFILFPRHLGSGFYDQIVSFCQQANFSPKVVQEAVQMQTIIGLVSASMGVALVPASLQNLQRSGVVYKLLEGATPHVEVAIAWRSDNITPVLREFLLAVKQHIQKRSSQAT